MEIKRQFTINAPSTKTWDVLGHQFDQVDRWASAVFKSSPRTNDAAPVGAPMAGRTCDTELGPFKESIVEFDEDRKIVSYDASGAKMPFFVKRLNNRWTVTPLGKNKSRVDMRLTGDLLFPFSVLMGPVMKWQFSRVVNRIGEELGHFVETGNPHPRKVQADLEAQAKTA